MSVEQNQSDINSNKSFEPTRHIQSRYSMLFLALMIISIVLIQQGVVKGGYIFYIPMIASLWCATAAGLLSKAYQENDALGLGKMEDGRQSLSGFITFFPYLIPLWIRQFFITRCTKEPAYNEVLPGIFIGKRLSAAKALPKECTTIVDLCAEFPEAKSIRSMPGYKSFPILEASICSKEEFCKFIETLPERGIYIHCGQGHGRTGFFTAAFLLERGYAKSVDEAEKMLVTARPKLKLRKSGKTALSSYYSDKK